ncbi:hypothetical protein TNIN_62821 [Trichonephila inaurata madagascariensis]|uniref:Uncharacterized protein n=1 Tax=Trichonephila inaurata madagascariensis TaxID=2747483 RepID=A0A8X7BVB3_9ARAC|nr:hypothetical protein TNIN_62821 [Trichonephila inaurata madagascariensis]
MIFGTNRKASSATMTNDNLDADPGNAAASGIFMSPFVMAYLSLDFPHTPPSLNRLIVSTSTHKNFKLASTRANNTMLKTPYSFCMLLLNEMGVLFLCSSRPLH